MSYNGYSNSTNSYSPYYQQSAGQDGRAQYAEQSRGSNAYQNNSFQPLSAYQSSQAPRSSTAQSTNAGTAYTDPVYGSEAVGGRQDSRAGYNDRRSSVDTTALGNLAYASSLGREDTNLQQVMTYNRAQNTTGYSTQASYGINSGNPVQYGIGHQRTDSSGLVVNSREDNSRAQPATASPSFEYSANSGNAGYQSQQTKAGSVKQSQIQYPSAHFSQSPNEPYRLNQYNNPSRPSSGQAVHRPTSTTGSHGVSPTVASDQNVRGHSDGNFRAVSTSARPEQPRVPTPQQQPSQTHAGTSTGPQVGRYTQNVQSMEVTSGSASNNGAQSGGPTSSMKSAHKPPGSSNNASNVNQTDGNTNQNSTPTHNQFPTTVNPSQVFNDAEYKRRQAAAAEDAQAARKKAVDEPIVVLSKKDTANIPAPTHADGSSSNHPNATSEADAAKKEQMELEMKQMIEKMRDYKSKDPSLFSQIWEQVKKGPPAQRASPQVATQGSSASPIVVSEQLPSPIVQLPPEFELPAAHGESFPPIFDRGRFPAQRRRRGGANFTPEHKRLTPKGSAKSTTEGSNVDPGNETMQRAMADFHRNSGSPVPPPQVTNQTAVTHPPPIKKQGHPTPTPMSASGPSATPTPSAANSQAQNKPPPKAGGTYWPENKKRQLAEAARAALMSSHQNVGKVITIDDIHQLLDQNPSYTQMCEILEYRGFVIDRGQFARLLLSAVPDLGSASTPKTPTQPQSHHSVPPPSTAPPPNGLPAPTAQYPPLQQATSQAGPPRPMPYSTPPTQPTNGYLTPYAPPNQSGQSLAPQAQMTPASRPPRDYRYADPSNTTSIHQPRQYPIPQQTGQVHDRHRILYPHLPFPPPPPSAVNSSKNHARWGNEQNRPATSVQPPLNTKQDMARKRSFGEIVDLTQATSDDEDSEPPSQRSRVNDPAVRVYTVGRSVNSGIATPNSVKDTTNLEDFRHKPTGKEAYLRAPDIIRPMNKRQDALRRSSYNPKTIARDILLAIGRHPTMAPLNSHLDVLRERFTAVNYESDLSTFRWDLVDPGGPPPVQHTTVDEDSHHSRRSSGKRVRPQVAVVVGASGPMEVESGQGRRRNEGFKPTRGGHIASGTRPKPIGTNASTNSQTSKNVPACSHGGNTRTSLSDSGLSRFVHNDLPVMLNNITGTSGKTSTAQSSEASTPAGVSAAKARVPGRVGRPPGAKNRNPRPDKGTPKKPEATPTQQHDTSPKYRLTPNTQDTLIHVRDSPPVEAHTSPVRTPSSSLQNRPRISTTPAKPSGLRNAMSPTDGIAVVIPSRSPSVMEGSPAVSVRSSAKMAFSKPMPKPDAKQSATPSYRVYKCYWDKCPAELHNLETLRKHVRKHRNEEDFEHGPVSCKWANCGNSEHERLTFETVEAWDQHVTRKHVEAVADDSTHFSGDESSEVLSDWHDQPVIHKAETIRCGGPSSVIPSSVNPMVVLPS